MLLFYTTLSILSALYLTNLIHQLVRHQEQARAEDKCKNI